MVFKIGGGSPPQKPSESRPAAPKLEKAEPPRPSVAQQLGQSSFEPRRHQPVALNVPRPPGSLGQPQATTLRSERLGDGQANCLEKAARLARPGDNVVLFSDRRDGVGHAVVQHPDGSVTDPNRPSQPYASMQAWRQANPAYQQQASVSQATLSRVLAQPPGAQRDQALQAAGLSGVANLRVADGVKPGTLGELGYLTVTAPRGLNIRETPDVNGTWHGTIPPGTVLVIQPRPEGVTPPDDGRNWTYVRSPAIEPGGQPIEGWISADPALVAREGPRPSDGTQAPTGTGGTTGSGGTTGTGNTVGAGDAGAVSTGGTPAQTATAMFADAQSRLDPDASQWNYKCLPFVSTVAQAAGVADPALMNAQTPREVISTLRDEGRLHPMTEPPPPGAIVLWEHGGYHENGSYVQTGHAAIATGDPSNPYITTQVTADQGGVNQRGIYSLEPTNAQGAYDPNGSYNATPPAGWFIPENPS